MLNYGILRSATTLLNSPIHRFLNVHGLERSATFPLVVVYEKIAFRE